MAVPAMRFANLRGSQMISAQGPLKRIGTLINLILRWLASLLARCSSVSPWDEVPRRIASFLDLAVSGAGLALRSTEGKKTMSLVSKALITAATVFVSNEARRYASALELDDVLRPMGLQRRSSHLGESLLFMGAGVVVGGAAAMILASTTRNDIAEWLSRRAKETVDDAKDAVSQGMDRGDESQGSSAPVNGDGRQSVGV